MQECISVECAPSTLTAITCLWSWGVYELNGGGVGKWVGVVNGGMYVQGGYMGYIWVVFRGLPVVYIPQWTDRCLRKHYLH